MEVKFIEIKKNECSIPGVLIAPEKSFGAVLLVHGYGGCKEEIAGLALRIADAGFTACVIDQPGHGENKQPLDDKVLADVENATDFCRRFGKVAAIGHSSGGRFVLSCNADFTIGISPALATDYGEKTREILDHTRGYRVVEQYPGVNYDILKNMPVWKPKTGQPSLILYGTRDVPEIKIECRKLQSENINVLEIENAMHNDIYLLEKTFTIILSQLKKWFEQI